MEWPPSQQIVPVVLNGTRPGRNRARQNSEHPNHHQTIYFQDQNGMLVPAGGTPGGRVGRSSSVSGPYAPGQTIIYNEQWQETSPGRGHHRRSSHGHDHHYSDDDDWEEHHARRQGHSRGRGRDSRTPSPYYDSETEERLRKLKKLEKKEEEEAAQERWEEEQILKAARKAKKQKQEEEMKKRAVKEYELKKLEEAAKAEKKKKEEDEAFRKKAIETFAAAGYSKKSVIGILEEADKGKKKEKGHGRGGEVMDLSRPTYIKVNKKHLSPDTLNEYNLPWQWDDVSHASTIP